MSKILVDKLPSYAAECPFSREVNGIHLCACEDEPMPKCVLEVNCHPEDCVWLREIIPG